MRHQIKRFLIPCSVLIVLALVFALYQVSLIISFSDGFDLLNLGIMEQALESGANPNYVYWKGKLGNPIFLMWDRDPTMNSIKSFLNYGADVNYKDENGTTLLMYASGAHPAEYSFSYSSRQYSAVDLCQLFLDYGADIDAVDKFGMRAIDYAAQLSDAKTLSLLLKYGADVDKKVIDNAKQIISWEAHYLKNRVLFIELQRKSLESDLPQDFVAAVLGNSETLVYLMNDLKIETQRETIFYASAFCNTEAFIATINADNSRFLQGDSEKNTLLDICAMYGVQENLVYLLRYKKFSSEELETAYRKALSANNFDSVQALLEFGVPVQPTTLSEWEVFDNPMCDAARYGNVEMLQILIKYGFPLTDLSVWNAMKVAAKFGHGEVIQYFHSMNFDIDYQANNTSGNTSVLCDACWAEQVSVVEMLIGLGADINAHQKCLPVAAATGNYELCMLLLEAGASVDTFTQYSDGSRGKSALEVARDLGYIELVELFEDTGTFHLS